MPGLEVSPSVDSSERPLFRSHKTLPRRGLSIPTDTQPASPEEPGTVAAPAPPLTPPGAIHDEAMDDEPTPRKPDLRPENSTGMVTPRRPSKPPTPDVTPPQTLSLRRPPLNQFIHPSSSSRAESFQTAREEISSDGDMETPVQSSQNTAQRSRQKVASLRQNAPNGVRAKLTYTKDTPSSASQPHSETEYETGFESFDGEWTTNQNDGSPKPLKEKRKPPVRNQRDTLLGSNQDTLDVVHLDASLTREMNLRDRVRRTNGVHEITPTPSMERFREEIGWPSQDTSSQAADPESRRLSALSSTSTVEAMIIDSPKRAQRLLRHTEKRSSLRSVSSPITRSEHASTASNPDSQHRLVHKAARISEENRRSIASDASFSTKTIASTPRASADIIRVVVIPERRSSLRSGPNSQISSRHGSQRSSRRPPVSEGSSSVNGPRQKKRTMSDSFSSQSRDRDSRGRPFGRPIIPPRSSSLSAPTSRNNSRSASLTSESLRSHTLAMDLEMQKRRDLQPVSPPRHNILGSNGQSHNDQRQAPGLSQAPKLPTFLVSAEEEDMSTLRPPSLPYTQWSIPSSSPGPIEIREATAVSLFAHRNRSLLLVDQRLPPGAEAQTVPSFHDIRRQIDNPKTPDNPTDPAMYNVDSPLKNPRPPPKPPIYKAPHSKPLPPLPTQADGDVDTGEPNRRQGSVRRPGTARPRSNSFTTIVRSLSIKSAKNRKAGLEMDSRLHPMWRPRGFWDDVSGSPKKQISPGANPHHHSNDSTPPFVNNSLGLPQYRVVIQGPPSLARRSPEMRRMFNSVPSAAHYNASNASLVDRGMFRTGSPFHPSRYQVLSRWGIRLRSMNVRNVRNRLRRMRQRRDERKRVARRENLKQSIGAPLHVVSGASHGITR
ncbi:hypothetical protein N7466_009680 [Penicillium verhagenii]|uniref:uncharacterized protein n=1 Tax=Penicillium verhagenii TaxID=1562060 RepID=UPI0025451D2B|nr:uncharacterized protein N7466_009680 [Penicillium verhagenii]KAJ5921354.1 hypothetical protein N7466_009680 [Penicillium verhagenii]